MRFDANVRYLNSRALGADLFSGIESPGDGVVLVSTTAAWQNISPAGQRGYHCLEHQATGAFMACQGRLAASFS
jgi:hypothetical protein